MMHGGLHACGMDMIVNVDCAARPTRKHDEEPL